MLLTAFIKSLFSKRGLLLKMKRANCIALLIRAVPLASVNIEYTCKMGS